MDIQNVIWRLAAIADSSIVDSPTRQAAKESVLVLSKVYPLLDLGSGEELTSIPEALRDFKDMLKVG